MFVKKFQKKSAYNSVSLFAHKMGPWYHFFNFEAKRARNDTKKKTYFFIEIQNKFFIVLKSFDPNLMDNLWKLLEERL